MGREAVSIPAINHALPIGVFVHPFNYSPQAGWAIETISFLQPQSHLGDSCGRFIDEEADKEIVFMAGILSMMGRTSTAAICFDP